MEVGRRIPSLGISVEVEECFVHCVKAFNRSNLWNPSTWIEKNELPDMAKVLADHAKLPGMGAEMVSKGLADSMVQTI